MKTVLAEHMQELDRRAMSEFKIAGTELMERAGRGVADGMDYFAEMAGLKRPGVLLLAGRGNNGGDAFCAARHLKEYGWDVQVWVAGDLKQIRGDALHHLRLMQEAKIAPDCLPTTEEWRQEAAAGYRVDFIVDGLLGTGSRGPARGPAAAAIEFVNQVSSRAFVVAIDLPSGIDPDTGVAEGPAVRADLTVTLGLPKRGLVQPAAVDAVGRLELHDLELPAELLDGVDADPDWEWISAFDFEGRLPARRRSSHKGDYGHVLLVGGARGYAGSIALAARGALRSGAGLVSVLAPSGVASVVASLVPEAMVHGVDETADGTIAASAWDAWAGRIPSFDAVLAGPGLSTNADTALFLDRLRNAVRAPLVLDADALNAIAASGASGPLASCPVVLTPHPGEMGRLLGSDAARVQADRGAAARTAARRFHAVTVLKGAGTIVTRDGEPLAVNLTGNPGMATGGVGDVLAGFMTGWLGQGLDPLEAARLAVYVHGRAGDSVALRKSMSGLTAGDIAEELPFATREIAWR